MSNETIVMIALGSAVAYLAAGVFFVRTMDRWCARHDTMWSSYEDNKLGRGVLVIGWFLIGISLAIIAGIEALGRLTVPKEGEAK